MRAVERRSTRRERTHRLVIQSLRTCTDDLTPSWHTSPTRSHLASHTFHPTFRLTASPKGTSCACTQHRQHHHHATVPPGSRNQIRIVSKISGSISRPVWAWPPRSLLYTVGRQKASTVQLREGPGAADADIDPVDRSAASLPVGEMSDRPG
ncbi:hypothetical protein GY45DRAFT_942438 [Cubamyces sp. BRFM 1775]|nr:hypothetical protein GY45DRAFT_942438 [Cubamyces sp. BRFM 1775]